MGNEQEDNNKKNISFFKSFIPQKISNETAINFFNILRASSKNNNFPDNLSKNEINYKNHLKLIEKNNGYIENQHCYKDMYYGNKTLDYNGCGIISVFNSLNDLTGGNEISLPLIIEYFENDGIVLSGMFGTAPTAIKDFFINQGFITISSTKEEEFDKIGENNDSFILTFYNDKFNIFNKVHITNITKKNNKYYLHNNGVNCHLKLYDSISELIHKINKGESKGIFLIGIKKKNI